MKASDRHPPGIAPYRGGWRVYVRIRGVYRSKVFPGDTSLNLEDERENLRVDLRRELDAAGRGDMPTTKPEDEPFDVAADRYLPAVKSLRTYAERERDIALWVAEFGHRTRGTISSADIRTIRDRWLSRGPRMVQKRSNIRKAPSGRLDGRHRPALGQHGQPSRPRARQSLDRPGWPPRAEPRLGGAGRR